MIFNVENNSYISAGSCNHLTFIHSFYNPCICGLIIDWILRSPVVLLFFTIFYLHIPYGIQLFSFLQSYSFRRGTYPSTIFSLSFGQSMQFQDILVATSSSGSLHVFSPGFAINQRWGLYKTDATMHFQKLMIDSSCIFVCFWSHNCLFCSLIIFFFKSFFNDIFICHFKAFHKLLSSATILFLGEADGQVVFLDQYCLSRWMRYWIQLIIMYFVTLFQQELKGQ